VTAQPPKRLNGIRSLCRGCGQYFNGVSVFEHHRVGTFGTFRNPGNRRCLTVGEMTAKGWRLTAAGFWTSGKCPAIRAGGEVLAAIAPSRHLDTSCGDRLTAAPRVGSGEATGIVRCDVARATHHMPAGGIGVKSLTKRAGDPMATFFLAHPLGKNRGREVKP
jgi:hypothetical protein